MRAARAEGWSGAASAVAAAASGVAGVSSKPPAPGVSGVACGRLPAGAGTSSKPESLPSPKSCGWVEGRQGFQDTEWAAAC